MSNYVHRDAGFSPFWSTSIAKTVNRIFLISSGFVKMKLQFIHEMISRIQCPRGMIVHSARQEAYHTFPPLLSSAGNDLLIGSAAAGQWDCLRQSGQRGGSFWLRFQ